MSGIASAGNSMSTTGPITRAIRPVPVASVPGAFSFSVAAVAVMALSLHFGRYWGLIGRCARRSRPHFRSSSVARRREGVRAADDLADLLRDLGLARGVGEPRELLDDVGGVVRRGLHRPLPRRVLAGRGLQEAVEDPGA